MCRGIYLVNIYHGTRKIHEVKNNKNGGSWRAVVNEEIKRILDEKDARSRNTRKATKNATRTFERWFIELFIEML